MGLEQLTRELQTDRIQAMDLCSRNRAKSRTDCSSCKGFRPAICGHTRCRRFTRHRALSRRYATLGAAVEVLPTRVTTSQRYLLRTSLGCLQT